MDETNKYHSRDERIKVLSLLITMQILKLPTILVRKISDGPFLHRSMSKCPKCLAASWAINVAYYRVARQMIARQAFGLTKAHYRVKNRIKFWRRIRTGVKVK